MSELDLALQELRRAAQSLNTAADGLASLFGGTGNTALEPAVQPEPAPEPKPVTLEQVRAVLAEKSRAGHTDEVRELLGRHGAAKLSEIAPAEYPALLKEAEELA
jgi:hypothetical protein